MSPRAAAKSGGEMDGDARRRRKRAHSAKRTPKPAEPNTGAQQLESTKSKRGKMWKDVERCFYVPRILL